MLTKKNVAGAALGLAGLAVMRLFILPMIYGFAIMAGWIGR